MTTTIYCETDPISARWVGVGRLLTAFEVDQNFYLHDTRIAALEAAGPDVAISYITLHGDQLEFHMSDHSVQGPFTIPLATFRNRGTWQPTTPYAVYDIFTINGSLYLVDIDHISASTFDPGATNGLGADLYTLLINIPGSSLPAGGATAQVLQKATSSDYAVTWGYKLPTGGSTGQVLKKNSNTNQDATWQSLDFVLPPPDSPAGVPGYLLATVDGTPDNMEWINPHTIAGTGVSAPPSSPAGNPGQVLSTVDGTATDTAWVDQITPPPPSPAGFAGQALVTLDGTTSDMGWAEILDLNLNEAFLRDGDQLRFDAISQKWINRTFVVGTPGISGGNIAINPDLNPLIEITPTAGAAMDNSARTGKLSQIFTIVVTTSGTSSFNLTFSSSDWVTQGTLATGTVSGKKFILTFMCDDGGKAFEINRIGPI